MINYHNCHHNLNYLFNSKNTFTERKTTRELQILRDANNVFEKETTSNTVKIFSNHLLSEPSISKINSLKNSILLRLCNSFSNQVLITSTSQNVSNAIK